MLVKGWGWGSGSPPENFEFLECRRSFLGLFFIFLFLFNQFPLFFLLFFKIFRLFFIS